MLVLWVNKCRVSTRYQSNRMQFKLSLGLLAALKQKRGSFVRKFSDQKNDKQKEQQLTSTSLINYSIEEKGHLVTLDSRALHSPTVIELCTHLIRIDSDHNISRPSIGHTTTVPCLQII